MALTVIIPLPHDMKGLDFVETHFKFIHQRVNDYNGGNTTVQGFGHTLVGIINLNAAPQFEVSQNVPTPLVFQNEDYQIFRQSTDIS